MEEYIFGEVNSYDAIFDSQGNPLFETGNVTPNSIMDIVNNNDNSIFYILKDLRRIPALPDGPQPKVLA